MHARSLLVLLCLLAAVLIAACAAAPSPLNSTTWRDPSFNGPPFRKVFVVGLSSKSLKDQRGFENLMVSSLQGYGIAAVPGWQFVATDHTPDQATIRAAVAQAGADAVLLVRLSAFTTETAVGLSPGVVVPAGYALGASSTNTCGGVGSVKLR